MNDVDTTHRVFEGDGPKDWYFPHCYKYHGFFNRDTELCWGQVEFIEHDPADGGVMYLCQGHKPNYRSYDVDGPYVPPPGIQVEKQR